MRINLPTPEQLGNVYRCQPWQYELEAVRSWFADKDPVDVVGVPNDAMACPMAKYFGVIMGTLTVINPAGLDCPAWAHYLMVEIDKITAPDVTAGEVVAIFDRMPEQYRTETPWTELPENRLTLDQLIAKTPMEIG